MSCSVDAGQLADGGLDVARHGEVDHAAAPLRPLGERPLHLLGVDDVVRRVGRADDDVGGGEALLELVHRHRLAVEAVGELRRPSAWCGS